MAVLCFEQDAERCHRTVVVEEVLRQADVTVTALAPGGHCVLQATAVLQANWLF